MYILEEVTATAESTNDRKFNLEIWQKKNQLALE